MLVGLIDWPSSASGTQYQILCSPASTQWHFFDLLATYLLDRPQGFARGSPSSQVQRFAERWKHHFEIAEGFSSWAFSFQYSRRSRIQDRRRRSHCPRRFLPLFLQYFALGSQRGYWLLRFCLLLVKLAFTCFLASFCYPSTPGEAVLASSPPFPKYDNSSRCKTKKWPPNLVSVSSHWW